MHDLTIEHIRTCKANVSWQKKYQSSKGDGTEYTVSFGATPGGPYAYGFSCDCPAGQHGKPCKHIKQAQKDKCNWNWEAWMGSHAEANPDDTCPKCGGETTVIRVGV